ncbi:hypothetical protein B0J11DRAFT_583819 [Dendryphion nanum]|uniref:Uncharacterized protein n=1 Tax=Dendryphion nanum TaxID=256645 RepID=A0A9P9DDB3_9PLEO|nr:hypothetical protein B0J11DRAFT_583819 [Dendryphion nanum]
MKFFAILAIAGTALAAGAYDTCSVVTVTKTVTLPQHTPSGPGKPGPTAPAPYPTSGAPYPSSKVSSKPSSAVKPYPTAPAPSGSGVPKPSGTGAYSPKPPQFTGAASGLKVGGALAGVGAVAAFFL